MSLFKLAKLQIEAYKDSARKTKLSMLPGASTFEVMYNPESFSLKYESEFQKAAGVGAGSQPARFVRSGAKVLNLKLIIDGTRVSMLPAEVLRTSVAEKVDAFLELCFVRQGEIHEPSYLRVLWGAGPLQAGFDCRLKSVDVTYTSFGRDGAPLRAELAVSFIEALHPPKLAAKERLSSPDLTHLRTVAAGDTLPLLCAEIYGSSRHYLRVATANGLDDFRELVPGTQLHFPPFDKGDKGDKGDKRKKGAG